MEQRVLAEMDRIIDAYFHVEDLNQLLKTFVRDKAGEGKSMWSELTLCCYYMLNGSSDDIYAAAARTELLILALDIVDDIQDQDNIGKAWMQCDPALALNAIIAFILASIGDMTRYNQPLKQKWFQLITRSINGQQRDLSASTILSESDYFTMIQEKSSSLINLAFSMGYGYIEDCDSAVIAQLDELAQYIGVAAQIKNDTRDVLRLDLKSDVLQKKKTLPILFLLGQSKEKLSPIHLYYKGKITREELLEAQDECLKVLEDSGCVEYARTIQFLYVNKVEELFESLSIVSPWKDKLKDIVMAAIDD